MAQGVFRGHNISIIKLMDWPCPAPHLHSLLFEIQQMDSTVHVNENRTKITTRLITFQRVDISPWLHLFKHKAWMRNRIIMFVMHVFNLLVQTCSSLLLKDQPFSKQDTLSSFCPGLSAIPFITVNVCWGKWKITPGCVCVCVCVCVCEGWCYSTAPLFLYTTLSLMLGCYDLSLSFSCIGSPFVSITDARLYFCCHMINVVAPRRDVEL